VCVCGGGTYRTCFERGFFVVCLGFPRIYFDSHQTCCALRCCVPSGRASRGSASAPRPWRVARADATTNPWASPRGSCRARTSLIPCATGTEKSKTRKVTGAGKPAKGSKQAAHRYGRPAQAASERRTGGACGQQLLGGGPAPSGINEYCFLPRHAYGTDFPPVFFSFCSLTMALRAASTL